MRSFLGISAFMLVVVLAKAAPPAAGAPGARAQAGHSAAPVIGAAPAVSARELNDPEKGPVTCLAFSADGTRLLAGTKLAPAKRDPTTDAVRLLLWDLNRLRLLWIAERHSPGGVAYHPDPVGIIVQMRISADGKSIVTKDGRFHVWDAATGSLRGPVGPAQPATLADQEAVTTAWAVSPDCGLLAVASAKHFFRPAPNTASNPNRYRVGDVAIWDLRASKVIATLPGEEIGASILQSAQKSQDWISALAFSPDGHRLAAVCGLQSQGHAAVKLWDVKAARLRSTMKPPQNLVQLAGPVLDWLTDGKTLALRLGSSLELWDTAKGEHTGAFSLSGLPTGFELAATTATAAGTRRPPKPGSPAAVREFENSASALSADGTRLAVQTYRINPSAKPPVFESEVVVFDVAARRPQGAVTVRLPPALAAEFAHRVELRGNSAEFDPRGLAFPVPLALSADGRQLAVGEPADLTTESSLSGVVRVYDVSRLPRAR